MTPSNTKGQLAPLTNRFPWLALLVFSQLLYFPVNRIASGGVSLATPLDQYVPFWPVWAVPYLLSLVWWEGCFIWAAIRVAPGIFRAFVIAAVAMTAVSYAVYLLYPTYVERPAPNGTEWGIELVRFVFENDRPYNAFPSGHAYTTTMIFLFWSRWYPRKRWLWLGIASVIILSALFTGQHNLLDISGGVLLGWGGYRFGTWLDSRWQAQAEAENG